MLVSHQILAWTIIVAALVLINRTGRPMRVLFLDDEETRHEQFRMNCKGVELVQVRNYAEAVAALAGERFDQVFLDHDLYMTDGAEKTGYDVAMFIVGMPEEKRPPRAVVHSWNPPGAQRIGWALHEAGIRTAKFPFSATLAPMAWP